VIATPRYISKALSYLYSNLYDWVCVNTVDQFTNDQKENIIIIEL